MNSPQSKTSFALDIKFPARSKYSFALDIKLFIEVESIKFLNKTKNHCRKIKIYFLLILENDSNVLQVLKKKKIVIYSYNHRSSVH